MFSYKTPKEQCLTLFLVCTGCYPLLNVWKMTIIDNDLKKMIEVLNFVCVCVFNSKCY